LSTRTLGEVGTLQVPGDPWRMTLMNGNVYVAGLADGAITVLGDARSVGRNSPTSSVVQPARASPPNLPSRHSARAI
jgi:hypothetical protein